MTLMEALRFWPEVIVRPGWTFQYLRDGLIMQVPNVRHAIDGPPLPFEQANIYKTPPTWADFERIKKLFKGPVAAKGILTPEDAKRALDHGADAVHRVQPRRISVGQRDYHFAGASRYR